jgi:hypothetical protein
MADIDVVKKGSHTWLWIMLAIVIALILWFVLSGSHGRTAQTGMRFDRTGQHVQMATDYQPHV